MATTAEIVVQLHAADGLPWRGDTVTLKILDPFRPTNKELTEHATTKNLITFSGIPADRGQRYAVLANADGHRGAGIFPVQPPGGGSVTARLFLIPDQPSIDLRGLTFESLAGRSPRFHQALTASGVTEDIFFDLAPERIAGALNVEAKLRSILLGGKAAIERLSRIGNVDAEGRIVRTGTEAVEPVAGLQQDRILGWVEPGTAELLQQAALENRFFIQGLNTVFHPGFPISFKEKRAVCSMQFSLADRVEDNGLVAADLDVDLFTGVNHIFGEALGNTLVKFFTGGKEGRTDPFTVYRLLLEQGIFPWYRVRL